jgi:hypothetical protein
VDAERSTIPNDPDFGTFRPGLLSGRLDDEPEAYLRLVANPFLALVYFVAWLMAMYESIFGGFAGALTPMLVVMLLAALGLLPYTLQYHCLDCGSTGRLSRWKKHACHSALNRRDAGAKRRFRGPGPTLQLVLWMWFLMAMAMFLNALGLTLPTSP